MSTATRLWADVVARATGRRMPGMAETAHDRPEEAPDQEVVALVRQLFLSSSHHSRIFVATAETIEMGSRTCERIGETLAHLSGRRVALVDSNSRVDVFTEIHEKLWRVPADDYQMEFAAQASTGTAPRFDYAIFSASVMDRAAPLFCSWSDGVVLVLSANQTRREAALRAKEILLSCGARLLGVVLDNRRFPIPETVYRRL